MSSLPEGAIESHSITATSYLTDDGEQAFMIETTGQAPMTSLLGLLVVAQQQIMQWGEDDG